MDYVVNPESIAAVVPDKPFTIQAGKRYNRRDGVISGVITFRGHGMAYPYADGGIGYNPGGLSNCIGSPSMRDLISEYIEPTAEPQDEWGPWMYAAKGHIVAPDIFEGIETFYRDGKLYKWRITKEQKAQSVTVSLWQGIDGKLICGDSSMHRRAIITTQGDNISIRWADE